MIKLLVWGKLKKGKSMHWLLGKSELVMVVSGNSEGFRENREVYNVVKWRVYILDIIEFLYGYKRCIWMHDKNEPIYIYKKFLTLQKIQRPFYFGLNMYNLRIIHINFYYIKLGIIT